MCNTTWSSQYIMFLLKRSVKFIISSGNFCQITTHQANRIKIRNDSTKVSAIISCFHVDITDNLPLPRRGLSLFNTSVTFEWLVFENCCIYITTIQDSTITDYLNTSSLYYTSSHSAALVFLHCHVNITHVDIYY